MSTATINAKRIGEKLIALRGDKTIADTAKCMKISPSALSMYENGRRIPRDDTKIVIAHHYGVSIDELFFEP